MCKVLLIEDVKEFQNIVILALKDICTLDIADDLETARTLLSVSTYIHIIIDIELPDGNGLEFCSELKNSTSYEKIPITVFTARKNLIDKILGFQIGIDEFLEKPIDYRELRARVEAKIKKINLQKKSDQHLTLGQLFLNLSTQEAIVYDKHEKKNINLTNTEFRLLWSLCTSCNRVLSRNQLLTMAYGENHFGTDRTIDIHICEIRKKLGFAGRYVKTVYGVGYTAKVS